MSEVGLFMGKPIPIGPRSVIRMGRNRYYLYLPTTLNWLWSNVRKVEVIVKIIE